MFYKIKPNSVVAFLGYHLEVLFITSSSLLLGIGKIFSKI